MKTSTLLLFGGLALGLGAMAMSGAGSTKRNGTPEPEPEPEPDLPDLESSTPAPPRAPRAPAPNGNGSGPSPSFKPTQRLVIKGFAVSPPLVIKGSVVPPKPTTQQAPSQTPGSTDAHLRATGIVDPAEYNPAAFSGTEHEIPWRYFRGTLRSQIGKVMKIDVGGSHAENVDVPLSGAELVQVRSFQEDWNRLARYLDNLETSGKTVDPRLADVRGLLAVNHGLLGSPSLSDDDRSTLRAIEIAAAVSDGSPDWPAVIKAIP